jgi:hypothetical protein
MLWLSKTTVRGEEMMQTGLLDWQIRFKQLDKGGDPLPKIQTMADWKQFRPLLEVVRDKERKSSAGRKPFDVVLMFKVLILQSLYNLSDEQAEFQIRDRLSFMRFLGLSLGDDVPDAKTIWLFREQLTEADALVRGVNISLIFSSLAMCFAGRADSIFLNADSSSARKGDLPGDAISFRLK